MHDIFFMDAAKVKKCQFPHQNKNINPQLSKLFPNRKIIVT